MTSRGQSSSYSWLLILFLILILLFLYSPNLDAVQVSVLSVTFLKFCGLSVDPLR